MTVSDVWQIYLRPAFHSKTKERAAWRIISESRGFLVRERSRKRRRNKRKLLTGYSSRKREKARTSRSQIGSKGGGVGGGEKHGHDCGKPPIKARGVILENWDSGCSSSFLGEHTSAVEESGQAKESYSSLSLFLCQFQPLFVPLKGGEHPLAILIGLLGSRSTIFTHFSSS